MPEQIRPGGAGRGGLLRRSVARGFPLFLLPTLAAFAVGFVWPFLRGLYLSLCRFTTTGNAAWVGLGNYAQAVRDAGFLHAFWFTALYTAVSLVLINLLAFAAAWALTQGLRGTGLFRTVFFLPNLIGGIVLGYLWSVIFDGVLSRFGTSILLDSRYGFWGLVVLMCWQQVGYMMIIYIAGLQAIPEETLEAARMDGAGRWGTLIHVTIPNMTGAIAVCFFLTLTNGFKLFDQNLALTGGQPYAFQADGSVIKTTEMLALNIYNTFYGQSASARGVAQAKAVLFFLLVAALSALQLRATRSREARA
ncbi:MAG: sugar ABC transporter permease [Oscillospiraceae bacterium]|nr:sugar ABC transporter permease [Oscillospiraceae bacterium]